MTGRVLLNIAILYGIFSQRINATFSEGGESSDIHVRKKRVIYRQPDFPSTWIREVPSIVSIKKNGMDIGVGSILSEHIVITAGHIVAFGPASAYKIYSGHEDINEGHMNNVIRKFIYYGIALLTINPGFRFNRNRAPIKIDENPIPRGAYGTVYGWGCNIGPPSRFHQNLRAITVPILTYRECAPRYLGDFQVREENICTHDPQGMKYCGSGDYGAPLIYMNRLVGIYIWSEDRPHHFNPDVFVNLLLPHLRTYINGYVERVEAQF